MFVFYEDLINDWTPDLRRLAAFIGRPERGDDPHVQASVGEFVEKELCHHRMSLEGLAGTQQISFATKGLYSALRGHAPREIPSDEPHRLDRSRHSIQLTLDRLSTHALETWELSNALTAERDALIGQLEAQTARVVALAADRLRMTAEAGALNETIVALSCECRERAAREQQMLQSNARLESALRDAALERDERTRDSVAARETLREIHSSSAWKLIAFSRRLIISLLPAESRRRQLFDSVVRRLAARVDHPSRA
jgi:hypothetical protein